MNVKLIGSVSALALALSAGAAMAQTNTTDNGSLGVQVSDSLNDNSTDNLLSNNNLSDNSDNSADGNDNRNQSANSSFNSDDDGSYNDNSSNDDNSTDVAVGITDSLNDNSTNVDASDDNSQTRVTLSLQNLQGNVSNVSFGGASALLADSNGSISAGDVNIGGGAYAAFAGVQTASTNSGLASLGQSATSISANANVTFGGNAP